MKCWGNAQRPCSLLSFTYSLNALYFVEGGRTSSLPIHLTGESQLHFTTIGALHQRNCWRRAALISRSQKLAQCMSLVIERVGPDTSINDAGVNTMNWPRDLINQSKGPPRLLASTFWPVTSYFVWGLPILLGHYFISLMVICSDR